MTTQFCEGVVTAQERSYMIRINGEPSLVFDSMEDARTAIKKMAESEANRHLTENPDQPMTIRDLDDENGKRVIVEAREPDGFIFSGTVEQIVFDVFVLTHGELN
jgi:hypothetical protein